jgi:hypothetical protein
MIPLLFQKRVIPTLTLIDGNRISLNLLVLLYGSRRFGLDNRAALLL